VAWRSWVVNPHSGLGKCLDPTPYRQPDLFEDEPRQTPTLTRSKAISHIADAARRTGNA